MLFNAEFDVFLVSVNFDFKGSPSWKVGFHLTDRFRPLFRGSTLAKNAAQEDFSRILEGVVKHQNYQKRN